MVRSTSGTLLVALLIGALVGVGATVALVGPAPPSEAAPTTDDRTLEDLEQFDRPAEFERYVERGRQLRGHVRMRMSAGGDGAAEQTSLEAERAMSAGAPQATPVAEDSTGPSRVGETNVQVDALDEPDLVKTDGTRFYYAPGDRRFVREPRPEDESSRPERVGRTHVIDASDPAAPEAIANINASGQLLQTGDRLVVLGPDEITGYDVTDPDDPEEVWTRPLEDRHVTARERNGTIYLVTRTAHRDDPCPIEPLGPDVGVPCDEVYHPRVQISADATYTTFALDAASGDVHDSVSFVGTGRGSVVYMSTDGLYVTYTKSTDRAALIGDFLTEEFDRTPPDVERRIAEIRSYEISPEATRIEIRNAVRSWLSSLDESERRAVREDLETGFRSYLADSQRALLRTGIVRVGVDDTDLSVDATASVPGRPLNQFSLSQGDGTVRVTTTIPSAGDAESVSDLYTLDAQSLDRLGSETGMGEGQRVYAVRYVGDTAYVITFRQVDPLHVVDLSNPADPTEVGTLQLPGFSNYLHPIDDDHVLGIGEEDGRVKAVLFDVSDPANPTVADDIKVAAGWSAVSRTHHAFTIDRKHGVFFLPTGDDSLVVDYTNGTLSREHTIDTSGPAERARYVDDYLYIFAGSELAVVEETDWSRETTLALPG